VDLLPVLFPQVRAAILRLLFADASAELHLRDLARRSGLALGTVQTELAKLSSAQLVVSERDGNRLYYRANAAHPLFPTLRQLVRQTTPKPGAPPAARASSATKRNALGADLAVLANSATHAEASAHTLTLNEFD
jgi:DNA-binding transcriptional ArsR family regulator